MADQNEIEADNIRLRNEIERIGWMVNDATCKNDHCAHLACNAVRHVVAVVRPIIKGEPPENIKGYQERIRTLEKLLFDIHHISGRY